MKLHRILALLHVAAFMMSLTFLVLILNRSSTTNLDPIREMSVYGVTLFAGVSTIAGLSAILATKESSRTIFLAISTVAAFALALM